jgi:outer membrane lipoprotein-sorting protein
MIKFLLLTCIFIFSTACCAEWSAEKTAALLAEIKRAADPDDIGRTVKSMRKKSEGTFLNIKMLNDTIFKSPDKIKQTIDVPGMQSVTVYFNGKTAVKADSLDGNTVFEKEALENLKMNVKLMNPAVTWDKIFDKISVADEIEKRDGKKYIAVTGSFSPDKKLHPCKFLIDPASKLVIYTFIKTPSALGMVESVTHNLEFKKIHGLVVPVKAVQSMLMMKFEFTLTDFVINQNYPDSMFEFKK